MRILFASTAGAGHFGPLVPFAEAARGSGHHIRVAAPASFGPAVERAGLDFVPVGERSATEADDLFARIRAASFEEANLLMVRDGYAGIFPRAALPALLAAVNSWRPDIIVRETSEVASLVVAVGRGIPRAQVAIGALGLGRLFRDGVTTQLAELGAAHGLAFRADGQGLGDEPILSMMPASLDDPGGSDVFRCRDAGTPIVADPLLEGEGPLIYASFGSEAAGQGLFPSLYAAVIGALADRGWRLVVTVGRSANPSDLGPIPAGVRVEQWIDQDRILPNASVVVCHGGYGTVLGALRKGVPLVVMPLFSTDQRDNGRRISDAGAGLTIGGPDRLEDLVPAVSKVLQDASYRTTATRIASEIDGLPPIADAVAVLVALATQGSS